MWWHAPHTHNSTDKLTINMATVQEVCAALLGFHSTDINNDVNQISFNQAFVCVLLHAYFRRMLLNIDVFTSGKIPR